MNDTEVLNKEHPDFSNYLADQEKLINELKQGLKERKSLSYPESESVSTTPMNAYSDRVIDLYEPVKEEEEIKEKPSTWSKKVKTIVISVLAITTVIAISAICYFSFVADDDSTS